MLKFGIRLADWFGSTQKMVELAVLAEKNGFDFAWVSHDVFMRSSFVTLASIANRTSSIMLGNTILNPYTMNPSELTMFLASMDELSNKRMVCGISAGSLEYMDWLGIPHQKPLTRTKESVELIRSLLSGKVTKYHGEEFNWNEQCYMRFEPPRRVMPIYIGGQGDKMLEYSGAEGDGSLPLLYPPDFAEYAVAKISEGARKAGKDPSKVDIAGCVWLSIARDRESAIIDPLKELVAYFGPLLGVKGLAAVGLSHEEFAPVHEEFKKSGIKSAIKLVNDKMLRLAIFGSPDDCIERIGNLEKAGVNQVLLGAPLGQDPKESVKIIGQKIIPYFNGRRTKKSTDSY
jgi:5,10-methylenetetrahydromethanopterin reductase